MPKNNEYILADESSVLDEETLSKLKPARSPKTPFHFGSKKPVISVDYANGKSTIVWVDHNGNEI